MSRWGSEAELRSSNSTMQAGFDLRQLECFCAVARYRSFTRAAAELFTSQPNVSTQIRKLEQTLGVKLFVRSRPQIELTDVGEQLLQRVDSVLREVNGVAAIAQEYSDLSTGTLEIAATATAGTHILPERLATFLKANEGLRVEIRVGNTASVLDLLRANEVEVGVCGRSAPTSEFQSRPFYVDPMIIIAAPGFVDSDTLDLQEFASMPKILREHGSSTSIRMEELLDEMGSQARDSIVARVEGTIALNECVAAGMGISLVPHRSAELMIRDGSLTTLRLDGFDWTTTFHVVYPKRRFLSAIAKAFLATFDQEDVVKPVAI